MTSTPTYRFKIIEVVDVNVVGEKVYSTVIAKSDRGQVQTDVEGHARVGDYIVRH